jgi:hypothetical protein
METNNQQSLFNTLVYLGFGEKLRDTLTAQMESGIPEFEIPFDASFDSVPVSASLVFRRSLNETHYHFYKYTLRVEDKAHPFGIYKGWGVTLKEGYNLLCGRAVYKKWRSADDTRVQGWVQLDLTNTVNGAFPMITFGDDYGFNISEAIGAMNITLPSSNWDMGMLIRSLERGNLQAVTMEQHGNGKRVSICANPADRNILVLPDSKNPEFETYAETDDVDSVLNKKKSKREKVPIK